ncbi:non-ribosomal peptide synthetase [Mammaliicoccus sciuri]|uniref:non-ribosomal peptide synthetase n=1 Tax=Mammaliicoccus sciuri TaxID=1296 RepID=UPI001431B65F|nr:non-ribosomal peptide synthetase [Mammaliicoccus sciuri]MBF0773761.1 amino acid adenylation domain-containing protein [Mammaliicoccus sciuri]
MSNIVKISKATNLQEGILYHSLKNQNEYIVQKSIKFQGLLNKQKLIYALNELQDKVDILKTDVIWDKVKNPLMIGLKRKELEFEESFIKNEDDLQKILEIDKSKIKIDENKLSTWRYINVDNKNSYIIFTHHHILLDGWSVELIIDKLRNIYESKDVDINNDIFDSYQKFDGKSRSWKEKVFWEQYLDNHNGCADLSKCFNYKKSNISERKSFSVELPEELYSQLENFCKINNFSINTIFQGAFEILVKRLCPINRLTYGTTISGRNIDIENVEEGIGLFIRTLPLKVEFSETTDIYKFLESISEKMKEVEENQNIPISTLTDIYEKQNNGRELFKVLYVYENFKETTEKWNGIAVEKSEVSDSAHYELSFILTPISNTLKIQLKYLSDYFSEKSIYELGKYYINILSALVHSDNKKINEINILKTKDQREIIDKSRGPNVLLPKCSILEEICSQIDRNGKKTAIIENGKKYNYSQLKEYIEKYTIFFEKSGVSKKQKVILYLDRKKELILSMLALWKLGACFVLCDKSLGIERIKHIIEDSGSDYIIVDNDEDYSFINNLKIDKKILELKEIGTINTSNKKIQEINSYSYELNSLPAYVLYTSGSTGLPKGVEVTHRNMTNYFSHCKNNYMKDDGVSILHSSISFDLTLTSIFLPLIEGRTLLISTSKIVNNLAEELRRNKASFIKLTPSHMELLSLEKDAKQILSNCDTWIVGGEDFSSSIINNWNSITRNKKKRFINEYGPTETTIGCSVYDFESDQIDLSTSSSIFIGKPINNTAIYILNEENRIQPPYVKGEICISGESVSNGYLNNSEQNSISFIEDPFSNEFSYMYKSGDIGFYDDDGVLHYIGRKDNQVKIRGHRVEIKEIERLLKEQLNLKNIAVKYNQEDDNLIAFSQDFMNTEDDEIIKKLQNLIPNYMIPNEYVYIEQLHLNNNMKFDYSKLKSRKSKNKKKKYNPKSKIEKRMINIWEEVLGITNIDVQDDLFTIGGNSIKAMKILSNINKEFDSNLSITDIMENPTIKGLIKIINSRDISDISLSHIKKERLSLRDE